MTGTEVLPDAAATAELVSTFDRNGFRTGLELKRDGAVKMSLGYAPDPLGRLAQLQRSYDGATLATIATYAYDVLSRRQQVSYEPCTAGPCESGYTFDDLGRLTAVDNQWLGQTVSHFDYAGYDGTGNYRQRTETRSGPGSPATLDFQSDDDYRLTDVLDTGTAVERFCYDQVGNRTGWGGPGSTACTDAWSYARTNRLLTDATWTYVHDANGRITSKTAPGLGTVNFAWNAEDQLTALSDGAGSELGTACCVAIPLARVVAVRMA